jgi:Flp pilus assembly protein TadD
MPQPTTTPLLARAFQLHQAGNLPEAAALYREVLRVAPDSPAALNNLGALQLQTGAAAAAVDTLSAFVALRPSDPIGYSNLGHALMQADRAAEALAPLQRAIDLDPGFAQAHNHLGMAFAILDRSDEAATAFDRALALQPTLVEAARNLGQTMNDAGDGAHAASAFQAWLRVDPANVQAHAGLALANAMQGRIDDAIVALERLALEHPADPVPWQTLGMIRYWDGRLGDAESAARRVLALQPGAREATFLVAGSMLGRGDYRNGWREFERRPEGSLGDGTRFAELPRWDGKAMAGRLLLHGEQGLGDVVQFARFVPQARERVGSIVLLLDQRWASLAPLLASLHGVDAIVTDAAELGAAGAPPIDARASILSLPYLLDNEVATIPAVVPYLRAPPAKVAAWAQRIGQGAALRVGLTWAVYARPRNGYVTQQRTVPFALIAALLDLQGIDFTSLQIGVAGLDARDAVASGRLGDHTAELRDFGDTAAVIEHLDLVITTDTSVAHVAGAMGKEVWMLDRYNACWRWRLSATASPWYPTMRIFRQPRLGDWESVLGEVIVALADRARISGSSAQR